MSNSFTQFFDRHGYLLREGFEMISSKSVVHEPENIAQQALEHLQDDCDIIFVCFDVDSIDPRLVPLANVPNLTGVGFETTMHALSVFVACGKVCGLVIVEVNSDYDPELKLLFELTNNTVETLATRDRESSQ